MWAMQERLAAATMLSAPKVPRAMLDRMDAQAGKVQEAMLARRGETGAALTARMGLLEGLATWVTLAPTVSTVPPGMMRTITDLMEPRVAMVDREPLDAMGAWERKAAEATPDTTEARVPLETLARRVVADTRGMEGRARRERTDTTARLVARERKASERRAEMDGMVLLDSEEAQEARDDF